MRNISLAATIVQINAIVGKRWLPWLYSSTSDEAVRAHVQAVKEFAGCFFGVPDGRRDVLCKARSVYPGSLSRTEISILSFGDEESPARSCNSSDGNFSRVFVGIKHRGEELYIGEFSCTRRQNTNGEIWDSSP
jgi:hypothetical protein